MSSCETYGVACTPLCISSSGLPLLGTLLPARRERESIADVVRWLGAVLDQLGGNAQRRIGAGARVSWLPIGRRVLVCPR